MKTGMWALHSLAGQPLGFGMSGPLTGELSPPSWMPSADLWGEPRSLLGPLV